MKKIIFTILAAALPLMAVAQRMTFVQLQEKYSGEGYSKVEITQAMLDFFTASGKKAPAENILSSIGGITGISILKAHQADDGFVADMQKVVEKGSGYKLLVSVSENGQYTTFHYMEMPGSGNGGAPPRISEIVMIMYGASDNLIMNIHGDFSIKQITSIVDQASSKD